MIDLVRGDRKNGTIAVNSQTSYASLPYTPSAHKGSKEITVAHVTVTLAPGEEADIRCWCVPGDRVSRLTCRRSPRPLGAYRPRYEEGRVGRRQSYCCRLHREIGRSPIRGEGRIASRKSMQNGKAIPPRPAHVGLGGFAAPGDAENLELAKLIRAALLEGPIPEISAVAQIEAVHAVDLPQADAKETQGGRPWAFLRATPDQIGLILKQTADPKDPHPELRDPSKWTPQNQMPRAIDLLIDGSVDVHGPSTGAVEIQAVGAAAARGRFDDVDRGRSRDDQSRGLWPKPDGSGYLDPKRLFGFAVKPDGSVVFDQEPVTLLRIEGFDPGTSRIDLLITCAAARGSA